MKQPRCKKQPTRDDLATAWKMIRDQTHNHQVADRTTAPSRTGAGEHLDGLPKVGRAESKLGLET
jgi:hypothetical protein